MRSWEGRKKWKKLISICVCWHEYALVLMVLETFSDTRSFWKDYSSGAMLVQCVKWQIIGTGVCTLHAQWVLVETVFILFVQHIH